MFLLFFSVIACLTVIGLVMLVRASVSAPEGEEDERGFHITSAEEARERKLPDAPLASAADLVFFR